MVKPRPGFSQGPYCVRVQDGRGPRAGRRGAQRKREYYVTMDATMHMNARDRWVDEASTPDERLWATWIHLSLLGHAIAGGFAIILTIVLWLSKKDQSAYIADHGREAVNFQISLFLYSIIATVFAFVLIGIPFLFLIPLFGLVGMIMGSIAANRGELFRYPMTIRFLRG